MFFIPDGVIELVNSPTSIGSRGTALVDDVSNVPTSDDFEIDFADDDNADTGDVLEVPTILSIVSQTVHRTSVGNEVIDVVIEVEDIAGVTNYEFRVTKT